MSAEENQNLSEIIFQNGSDRTKKIMHANSIYFNGKLAVKNKITPYTSMKGKEMNLLIKNIWKIQ